jgi:hypothetical protein
LQLEEKLFIFLESRQKRTNQRNNGRPILCFSKPTFNARRKYPTFERILHTAKCPSNRSNELILLKMTEPEFFLKELLNSGI